MKTEFSFLAFQRFRRELASAILVLALGFAGCQRREVGSDPTPDTKAPSVLLITLDTTRADRIGCYGYAAAETPTLDALAFSGVVFDQAFCQVPLTLPSHTSLLTGTYPATNGVRINGVIAKGDGVTTLAEVFQTHGYRTGAFISGLVLDSGFGLGRGFDVYDDNLGPTSAEQAIERPGNEVCDAALAWLAESATTPFFAWIHFFDPHSPYDPPEPYRGLLADPYDGEIAFADSQIRRLVDWIEAGKQRERTLIVVAGDHGEAFKEHGESEHGLFVYDTTMHVPLIFSFPLSLPTGRVVKGVVGLTDVFPTIIDVLGWKLPPGLEGASLAAMWSAAGRSDNPSRPVYGESEYPRLGYAWAPLRSLTSREWKYIEAPRPELYDRLSDPGELINVISEKPLVASQMRDQLLAMIEQMVPRPGQTATPDAELLERLESLGYVGGTGGGDRGDDPGAPGLGRDPKDMVEAYNAHTKAVGFLLKERFREVVAITEPLVRQSPESDQFYVTLGRAYLELGRARDAQAAFEAGLRLVPDNPRQLWRLGEALRRQNKLNRAITRFEAALEIMPDFAFAHCSLGDALGQQGKTAEAMRHYQQAVAADPRLARAHGRLGVAYAKQRQFSLARDHLQRYVELEPTSPHALSNLGNVLLELGRPVEATELLRKALEHDPLYAPAHQSLFQALLAAGRPRDAVKALRAAHEALPDDGVVTLRLAWTLATVSGDDLRNPAEALLLAREACEAKTPTANDLMVLAAAHAATGNFAAAVETARHALSLAHAHGKAGIARQIENHLRRYESGVPLKH